MVKKRCLHPGTGLKPSIKKKSVSANRSRSSSPIEKSNQSLQLPRATSPRLRWADLSLAGELSSIHFYCEKKWVFQSNPVNASKPFILESEYLLMKISAKQQVSSTDCISTCKSTDISELNKLGSALSTLSIESDKEDSNNSPNKQSPTVSELKRRLENIKSSDEDEVDLSPDASKMPSCCLSPRGKFPEYSSIKGKFSKVFSPKGKAANCIRALSNLSPRGKMADSLSSKNMNNEMDSKKGRKSCGGVLLYQQKGLNTHNDQSDSSTSSCDSSPSKMSKNL